MLSTSEILAQMGGLTEVCSPPRRPPWDATFILTSLISHRHVLPAGVSRRCHLLRSRDDRALTVPPRLVSLRLIPRTARDPGRGWRDRDILRRLWIEALGRGPIG